MFDWLSHLIEWFGSLIPRVGICRATHAGVKFRRGKVVVPIKPGIYFYWPIVTEVSLLPTARRTINLESQTLTTKDNDCVTVSVVVIYRIVHIVKALVDTEDIEDTIGDVALRGTVRAITERRFNDIRANLSDEVKKEITRSCRSALNPFGVKVLDCNIIDFAKTSTYRIVGHGGSIPIGG